jgi:predicted metal-dependent HD superfamily phosphohydrolase
MELLFSALEKHYSEPSRSYHNAHHIDDCLKQFDYVKHLATHPIEVEIALWFHDAIYDSRAKDNEERSAEWAGETLLHAGISESEVKRIKEMILVTRHTNEPVTDDEKLVVDIDLSILGRDHADFARYDHQIREEYSWVPEEQYRSGRSAVLESFLRRNTIYSTDFFVDHLEERARLNLTEAITRLRTTQK